MAIEGLRLIGERINPGFKSSKELLDNKDLAGLQALARDQVAKGGCDYLTVNLGEAAERDPGYLREVIQAVQDAVDLPLAFDYPNRAVQELCLRVYDPAKAGGRKPVMNSVTELRWDMLEIRDTQPFKVVLMASERLEDGRGVPNRSAEEVHLTARRMVERILGGDWGMTADDLFIDVSLGPVGADLEGLTKRAVDSIRLLGADPALAGTHKLIGLSNLSISLPARALDGGLLKVRLESAFLTLTVPAGLDYILGTPGRAYELLPADDFVMRGFCEAIELPAFEALFRIQALYQEG
ncbi:MAG: dihydropteroate synthase [Fimbriimonadaceae bacterium]|nr:dihydropteroate synthase [Fimbriimonadaceae bacterium]